MEDVSSIGILLEEFPFIIRDLCFLLELWNGVIGTRGMRISSSFEIVNNSLDIECKVELANVIIVNLANKRNVNIINVLAIKYYRNY